MIDRLFLSVGAMKAGTTWLHRQFVGHPDVFFCPEKEIHYFADPEGKGPLSLTGRLNRYKTVVRNLEPRHINPNVRRNLGWYADRFLAPDTGPRWYEDLFVNRGAQAYIADFSNLYSLLEGPQWAHVRECASELRVLYTMRHPLKRLWSHVKFDLEFSGRAGAYANWSAEEFAAFVNGPGLAPHMDYAGVLERLRAHLQPHEFKLAFFEDFRERPLEMLREIEAFLGAGEKPYAPERLEERINPSADAPMPEHFRPLVATYHQDQCARLRELGVKLPSCWEQD